MENEYVQVPILEIIRCSGIAKQNNESQNLINKLTDIFANAESMEVKIPIQSEEAKLILKYNNRLLLQNYITLESLSLAFNRLYFGKSNKELQKRVEKYYHKYLENITHNEDNTELKQEIILDEEAYNFIRKYSNYKEYELELIGKNSKIKKLVSKQEIKGKPIVE